MVRTIHLPHSTVKGRASISVHPGIRSLKGVLAGKKGKRMSFAGIRAALAGVAHMSISSPGKR